MTSRVTQRLTGSSLLVLVLGIGIALVVVVALVVMRGGGSTDPERLGLGECFDVPQAADRIGDVRRRPCSGPHGGEVFHVFDTTDPASPGYPSDAGWEALVYPVCDPAFEAFTGTIVAERLDIEYRYFVPTADRWAAGKRQVTCYIVSADGSPLTRSSRAAP
jgi:hypothetical protein